MTKHSICKLLYKLPLTWGLAVEYEMSAMRLGYFICKDGSERNYMITFDITDPLTKPYFIMQFDEVNGMFSYFVATDGEKYTSFVFRAYDWFQIISEKDDIAIGMFNKDSMTNAIRDYVNNCAALK